jgi:hypothetical protein
MLADVAHLATSSLVAPSDSARTCAEHFRQSGSNGLEITIIPGDDARRWREQRDAARGPADTATL